MKRAVILAVLLCGAAANANAGGIDNYRDLIRPHGHPRSDAIFNAAVEFCYGQTGANRNRADTPAFKRCMLGRGYRWQNRIKTPDPRPGIDYDY